MIPENKTKFLLNNKLPKINELKLRTPKDAKKAEPAKEGETEVKTVDVNSLANKFAQEIDKTVNNKDNGNTKSDKADNIPTQRDGDKTDSKYKNDDIWNSNVSIKDFVISTLKEAGFNVDENHEIVNELCVILVQKIFNGELDIQTDISSVAMLIDINLEVGGSLEIMTSVTDLVNYLLCAGDDKSKTTFKEVKSVVLKELARILKENEDNYVDPNTDNNIPTEIVTAEDALTVLSYKLDSTETNDDNMSIKDFLLQFKADASKYIQLAFGYEAGFSDVIAIFLATAVSETSGAASGLVKDVDLNAIKSKFLAFIQDMSFIDTTDSISVRTNNGVFDIQGIFPTDKEANGYRITENEDGTYHHNDSTLLYNEDGTPNCGIFLKFLVSYLQNDIYGGRLNNTQMYAVMKEVLFNNFGKGHTYTDVHSYLRIKLFKERDALNTNGNNTIFDELYDAMMKVANSTIKPLNTDDLTDASKTSFISNLFGNKTSLTAAQIYNSENSYLLSNDLGVRGIIQALVDTSEQYNIHNENDYKDFLNVFIRMIYEKCGEQVQKDSNGNPLLTKDILNKYFAQGNTLQDLKDFVQSKELRNAYYMENFVELGGINGEIDDFGQGRSGDCWLLSCLAALRASETGRQIISNAIHDNGDGTWTVTFHGGYELYTAQNGKQYWRKCAVDNSFTISLDEIMEAKASGNYAFGDYDVILLEIATAKLREKYERTPGTVGDPYIYSGTQEEMLGYLIGPVESTSVYVQIMKTRPEYAPQQAQKIKDWVMEQFANGSIEPGTVGNYMLTISYGGHAYAVTGVTEEGIYYVDPYHPNVQKFISWADLAECKVKNSQGGTRQESFIEFCYTPLPTYND